MPLKVIVTNRAALRKKYAAAGMKKIDAAIRKLKAADKKRGLTTKVVALDSASAMKKLKVKRVTLASDPRQNKDAVDGVFKALAPDYLMILGAIDVVPHQDLKNPVYDAGNDDDRTADGDLPYACEAAYSQKIEDFRGPTRVVGRLPDVNGGTDPAYLVDLLATAAGYTSRASSDYDAHLGMSAAVWQASTSLSLKNLFGSSASLQRVPPKGPTWSGSVLGTRAHFINCHGAPADFKFYGQQGNSYPDAHDASLLAGTLLDGTVASVECCYGVELYKPSAAGGQMGIANTYLAEGSYGFFGSSTIAYGPASGNGAADLICQYFLKYVREGASLGRAALQARQDFVQTAPILDPVDLKTLGQFNLLGDPSVHPVKASVPHSPMAKTAAGTKLTAAPEGGATPGLKSAPLRRAQLMSIGLSLASSVITVATGGGAGAAAAKAIGGAVRQALQKELDRRKLGGKASFFSFAVPTPAGAANWYAKAKAAAKELPQAVQVVVATKAEATSNAPMRQLLVLVATREAGAVVVRELDSR